MKHEEIFTIFNHWCRYLYSCRSLQNFMVVNALLSDLLVGVSTELLRLFDYKRTAGYVCSRFKTYESSKFGYQDNR
jgi:hypothetical protein